MEITKEINSYEDACKILGIQPLTLENFSHLPESQRQYYYSHHRIATAIEASKEGHEFDWNNSNEYKYYPWWDMETYGDAPAGSGFSYDVCGLTRTLARVGARLSTRSRAHTEHLAKVFFEDYRVIMKG